MKKQAGRLGVFGVLLVAFLIAPMSEGASVWAAPGDLFVQVELNYDDFNGDQEGCSILRVSPEGVLSEWVSNKQILALTGLSATDCDDTGLAVACDGTLYFNEDESDHIFTVSPSGELSIFVTRQAIEAVTGIRPDIDNGMTLGPDGHLYAADENCDCVIRVTIPGGTVSVVVSEEQITDVTGESNAELDGGIAVDNQGNIYITDDTSNSVLKVTPGGTVSVLAAESAIMAVTGESEANLDVGVVLGVTDGFLYVLDDEANAVLRIDTSSGAVSLAATEADIRGATGLDIVDPEGGIAINDEGILFVGDDGGEEDVEGQDKANIVRITPTGVVSLFVSDSQLNAFYGPLYENYKPLLRGSMGIQRDCRNVPVPTLAGWGVIMLSLLMASWAFRFLRQRKRNG